MKKFILYIFSLSLLSSCLSSIKPFDIDDESSINKWDTSLDQAKKELFEKSCNDEMKKAFEQEIQNQIRFLNSQQMLKSIQNMKAEIVCS